MTAGLSLPVLDLTGAAAIEDVMTARARDELYVGPVLEGPAVAALAGVARPRAFLLLRRHILGRHFSEVEEAKLAKSEMDLEKFAFPFSLSDPHVAKRDGLASGAAPRSG